LVDSSGYESAQRRGSRQSQLKGKGRRTFATVAAFVIRFIFVAIFPFPLAVLYFMGTEGEPLYLAVTAAWLCFAFLIAYVSRRGWPTRWRVAGMRRLKWPHRFVASLLVAFAILWWFLWRANMVPSTVIGWSVLTATFIALLFETSIGARQRGRRV